MIHVQKKKQCTNIIGHREHIRDPMISLLIKLNLSTCSKKQEFLKKNWSRSRADFPSQHIQIHVLFQQILLIYKLIYLHPI